MARNTRQSSQTQPPMEEEVISMGYAVKDARGGAAYLLANSFTRKSGAAPSPHKSLSKQLARYRIIVSSCNVNDSEASIVNGSTTASQTM